MPTDPTFDPQSAHRYFAANGFNAAWDLIDKPDRSAEEDERMVLTAHASLWHWTQRQDCANRNLSVGYWQLARIYALLKRAEAARLAAETALRYAQGEPPFYVGYAHEALARAARLAGDAVAHKHHLNEARWCAAEVTDSSEKSALRQDLDSLA